VARQLLSAFDAYAAESLPSVIEKLPESLEPKELWSRLESWVDRLPHDAVPMAYWQSSVESIIEEMGPARVESGSATGDRLPTDVLLEGIGSISKELAALGGPMSGGTFRRLVRERLTSSCDRWSTRASSVPIVAWEEIPLTSHPRVIVVGMNDGMLAMGVDGGPLLTGAVRSLACARCDGQMRAIHHRVFAELLAERHATFLVARSTGEGDPLLPHAWVLAGTVDEKARRLLDFFKRPVTPVETRTRSVGVWSLDVPRAKRNVAIDELPVTAFRDFLACPYRFYLRHVLKLRRVGEPPLELDPLQFGSLMHDVLREFAMSREATSTRPDEIAGSIETALVRLASRQFPRSAPSVTIQLEQIRVRLEAFASWQARWADQGWRICGTEVGPTRRQAALMVDSEPFYLSGRIDRIDYNADTNEWMLIDYKSSERAGTPAETHRDGDAWIDLQLPLYRHLVRHLTDLDPRPTDLSQVGLAYLAIPRDVTKTGELKAPWTEGELSEADEVARQVVRAIRQGDFGMPTPGAGDAFPDYDRVCQDGLFVRGGTDGD
jgi:RecB family exonuclease